MSSLVAAVAAAALFLLVTALRRPVLMRMAVRSAVRRKTETTLVVVGALLGTAIITGSLTVGDTLAGSVRAQIPEQLGPTDVIVRAADSAVAQEARARLRGLGSPHLDGMLTVDRLDAAIVAGTSLNDAVRAEPRATVLELDVADAARFGSDPGATGLADASAPGRGEALITTDLATALGTGVDDVVTVSTLGTSTTLTVSGVVPRAGVAGLAPGSQRSESMNVIVAPGALGRLASSAPEPAAGAGPQPLLLLSGTGDVLGGADAADALIADVRSALTGLDGVDVESVKADALELAETAGKTLQELFLGVGAFAVLAGVLLLVNVFGMLADERKPTLGIMRAVGMTRRDLVRMLVLEGTLYAAAAAALGALAGVGVGRAIVALAESIFAQFGATELRFSVHPATVATGFLAGLLVASATIAATSVRISRLNIIAAVRDLPAPPTPRRWWRTAALAVATAAFAVSGGLALAAADPVGALALPALAAMCATPLLVRVLPARATVTAVAAAVLAWAALVDQIIVVNEAEVGAFVVQGVVLVSAAVALLTSNQDLIGRALTRLGGGLVTRLGTAYPLAKRARTALTLSMFSLVVFTLVFMLVLADVFGSLTDDLVADEAGGYDVLATANPGSVPSVGDVEAVEGVARAVALESGTAEFRPERGEDFRPWPISGIDEAYLAGGPVPLEARDPRYPSDAAVWEAVLSDPSLAVIDLYFLQDLGGVGEKPATIGDEIVVRDPVTGSEATRTVAAVARAGVSDTGVLASRESVEEVATTATPSRFLVQVVPGADEETVAETLQAALLASGLQATSYRSLVEQSARETLQFFQLLQGYLSLGLVVGIAGLGVVMVRAVRERRREIGALRAVGLRRRTIGGSFLVESGFVAIEGVVVGTALALVTAWQVIAKVEAFGGTQAAGSAPWPQLVGMLAATLFAALLAALLPAFRASRVSPAQALRALD